MKIEKLDKTIIILFMLAFFAIVGGHIRRQNYNPEKELSVKESNKLINVEVVGEVNDPGEVRVAKGSKVYDAIYAAGGITEYADVSKIKTDIAVKENARIIVPRIGGNSGIQVNINTADANELISIPGIGETLANNIIAYRTQNGNFATPEDIVKVKGIGEKTYEKIKKYIITEETEK